MEQETAIPTQSANCLIVVSGTRFTVHLFLDKFKRAYPHCEQKQLDNDQLQAVRAIQVTGKAEEIKTFCNQNAGRAAIKVV